MATFVLIHGAWHTGACWNGVVHLLEEQGHKAYTPTVGGNKENGDKFVDIKRAYQPIFDMIVKNDLNDIILLGHSLGGAAVQYVAQAIPERVRRLIFMGAILVEDGQSIVEGMFAHIQAEGQDPKLAFGDSEMGQPYLLPFESFREIFISDGDLATAQAAYETLKGTIDTAFNQNFYQSMRKNLGLYRYIQYEGRHEIMYTNPKKIGEKILIAGQD
jgi:pimeloyl-ACP methyl ester carboxylesterase